MNDLRQGITGYRLPGYVEEILTHNYCQSFVRMTIIRKDGSYIFNYRPGNLTQLDPASLGTYEKLLLMRTLIGIREKAAGYLINGDTFLIEPELIYSTDGRMTAGSIRIMFYPDAKQLDFMSKLILFAERIRSNKNREEREIFDQFRETAESGDLNKTALFLDKNIQRIEGRSFDKIS